MTAKNEGVTPGLDRSNALLKWWGIPDARETERIEGQVKRFQTFASDLQRAYGEAYRQQTETLFVANERLVRVPEGFLHCRQAQKVIAAEFNVFAILFEGAWLQAKTWIDLSRKVQDLRAAMAREVEEEAHNHFRHEARTKPAARPTQVSNKDTSRHLEQA